MASPPSAAVIGSTGLVGSHILSTLLDTDLFQPIHVLARRAPNAASPRLHALLNADTTKWAASLTGLAPPPAAVFSALGMTRAAAGGLAQQWKIDHDLNVELARAAKQAGAKTFVFISAAGTRSFLSSATPYCKMKNGVEDVVKALDFEHAVIVKPGLILGAREESRLAEGIAQTLVRGLGSIGLGVRDRLGQDAEVIARAAVRAAQLAAEGKAPSRYWVLEPGEIVRLGRKEWPAKSRMLHRRRQTQQQLLPETSEACAAEGVFALSQYWMTGSAVECNAN